ncbi:aminotransferase class V-fold PLP-dependent enzyme, partial [Candidatus Dependentiae bacterium]
SAELVTESFEGVRAKVAEFVGAGQDEIIFTSGSTEGINFVADAWGRQNIGVDDEIIVTEAEHHANLLPWLRLSERVGAKIVYIPINSDSFKLDFDQTLLNERTKLVAVTHSSNVLGNIWNPGDFSRLIGLAKDCGAKVLVDAAQSVPHQKVDVRSLGADFLVFSGHKIMGPTGIGVLYINSDLFGQVEPYKVGGAMVHSALPGKLRWKDAPHKFEAGTPPIAQVVGLGAAIDYMNEKIDFRALREHENELCSDIVDFLSSYPSVSLFGSEDERHLVTFAVKGLHAHDLAASCGENDVMIRAGHHCAQLLHEKLDVVATARISVFCYNTKRDVDQFKEAFEKACKVFGV